MSSNRAHLLGFTTARSPPSYRAKRAFQLEMGMCVSTFTHTCTPSHHLDGNAVYMNLPICAVATVVLWLCLRHMYVARPSDLSWSRFARTFDFIGL